MANIDTSGLLTAIRSVLESQTATLRPIWLGTYSGKVYEGLSDDALSSRALVLPRYEPRVTSISPQRKGPPRNSDTGIYRVDVEVSVYRHLDASDKLTDATRDAARAACITDGDVIAQALEYPGNLSAVSTLLSSRLVYDESRVVRFDLRDGIPGLIETVHRFHGFMTVTQATTIPPLAVSGLRLWLRYNTSIVEAGGLVTSWTDAYASRAFAPINSSPIYASGAAKGDGVAARDLSEALDGHLTDISATAYCCYIVGTVHGAHAYKVDPVDGWQGDSLLGDRQYYHGTAAYDDGALRTMGFEFTAASAQKYTDPITITADTKYVFETRHYGGSLYHRANGTEVSVVSDGPNIVSNSGWTLLALLSGTYSNATISDVLVYSASPSDADRTSIREWLATQRSATL